MGAGKELFIATMIFKHQNYIVEITREWLCEGRYKQEDYGNAIVTFENYNVRVVFRDGKDFESSFNEDAVENQNGIYRKIDLDEYDDEFDDDF
jgi:hypothetical protein